MKSVKNLKGAFVALFLLLGLTVSAQEQLPPIPEECEDDYAIYTVHVQQKNYAMALPFWQRAVSKCPDIRKRLYIDGIKIYRDQITKEKDAARKETLIDSLLWIYDQRVIHFGTAPAAPGEVSERHYVSGRKGSDLMRYRPSATQEAIPLLDSAIAGLGQKTEASVLSAYLNANYQLFRGRHLDKMDLGIRLARVWEIIDLRRSKPFKGDEKIEEQLIKLTTASAGCEELKAIFKPRSLLEPVDEKVYLQIVQIYGLKGCGDSPLYALAIGKLVEGGNASFEMLTGLARLYENERRYAEVIDLLKQAAEVAPDGSTKANTLYQIAINYYKKGDYSACRTHARQALAANPEMGKAYILIGDAYAASRSLCAEGTNSVTAKAVYWLAEDYFKKAKQVDSSIADIADRKAAAAREQFPRKSEVFMNSMEVGATYRVGCWIKEETTVKTSD